MRTVLTFQAALVGLALTASACSRSEVQLEPPNPFADEIARREAFAKKTLERLVDEKFPDAGSDRVDPWRMTSTTEIQFDEGFSILSYEPAEIFPPVKNAFRWMGQRAHVRVKAHDGKAMKILLAGWAHLQMLKTHPVMDFFIDGFYVGSSKPIEKEHYWIDDITVPAWAVRRPWVDLEIRTNAVAFHWGDPPTLRVLLTYRFEWKEAD